MVFGPTADPDFVRHMAVVLDVYQRPYDPVQPMICLDEASRQLLGDTRRSTPSAPGHPARNRSELVRGCVVNYFLALEPLRRQRPIMIYDQCTRLDFAAWIKDLVDTQYPDAVHIMLVLDHLNIHSPATLRVAFPPEDARRLTEKLEIHYRPKQLSWRNVAELDLSVMQRKCLCHRLPDRTAMVQAVTAWSERRSWTAQRIDWAVHDRRRPHQTSPPLPGT